MFFKYPYSDMYAMNLDWMVQAIKEVQEIIENLGHVVNTFNSRDGDVQLLAGDVNGLNINILSKLAASTRIEDLTQQQLNSMYENGTRVIMGLNTHSRYDRLYVLFRTSGSTDVTYVEFNDLTDNAVTSFNGTTGAVTGVSSFNGATGAVSGVSSFNGATGAVTGVNSVNGSTGAVNLSGENIPYNPEVPGTSIAEELTSKLEALSDELYAYIAPIESMVFPEDGQPGSFLQLDNQGAPVWGGSPYIVIDTTLSVSGEAADAKATGDAVADLKSAFTSAEQTLTSKMLKASSVESTFTFSLGDVNTSTGGKVTTNYAAITGYKQTGNKYFCLSTDDYYYRIAFAKASTTSVENILFITDYVKGTERTNLYYPGSTYYKVVAVKDLTGTTSMADYLTDVQNKCRYYTGYDIESLESAASLFVQNMPSIRELYFYDKTAMSGTVLLNYGTADGRCRMKFSNAQMTDYVADTGDITENKYGICKIYSSTNAGEIAGYAVVNWPESEVATAPRMPVLARSFDLAFSPTIAAYLNAMGAKTMNVACIGDSITYGTITSETDTDKGYPYWFGNATGANVKNYGIPGASCVSWWTSVVVNGSYPDFVLDSTIDAVVIMLGTNGGVGVNTEDDTSFLPTAPYLPNTMISWRETYPTYDDYPAGDHCQVAYLCRIIEYIYANCGNDTKIILCVPPYNDMTNSNSKTVINSESHIRDIAAMYRLPVIDVLNEFGPNFITTRSIHSSDYLHFTEDGYRQLGSFIGNKFNSVIGLQLRDD